MPRRFRRRPGLYHIVRIGYKYYRARLARLIDDDGEREIINRLVLLLLCGRPTTRRDDRARVIHYAARTIPILLLEAFNIIIYYIN